MITNARIRALIRHVAPPSASEKHEMPGRGQTASQSNAHDVLAAIVIATEYPLPSYAESNLRQTQNCWNEICFIQTRNELAEEKWVLLTVNYIPAIIIIVIIMVSLGNNEILENET